MARLFGLMASVGRSCHFDDFGMLSRGDVPVAVEI